MDVQAHRSVPLSEPTYRALNLVARIDRMEAAEIVETLVAAYLETRLGAIHEGLGAAQRDVIDLAAQRERLVPSDRTRPDRRSRFRRSRHPRSGGEPSVGFGED